MITITQQYLPPTHTPWLTARRQQALADFQQRGFPTNRDEDWKYSDTQKLAGQPFLPATYQLLDAACIQAYLPSDFDCYLVVFVNGHYCHRHSMTEGLPETIVLTSLKTALEQQPQTLRPYLDEHYTTALHALNAAFMTDGVFLHLPANTVMDKPLYILNLSTTSHGPHMSHAHHVIVAESHTKLVMLQQHATVNGEQHFSSATTRIIAKANAVIEHYQFQQHHEKNYHFNSLTIQQARDSQVTAFQYDLSSGWTRNEVHLHLNENGASGHLKGLYLTRGKQHLDNHTRIEHHAPHTASTEHYQGILADAARAIFSGRILVHPEAQKVSAEQKNNNLLLSSQAEIDTQPQLEIFADDVKCSHGATVGELNKEALFYLQSRGLALQAAKDVLTYGFAVEMINALPIKALQHYLIDRFMDYLPSGASIKELV